MSYLQKLVEVVMCIVDLHLVHLPTSTGAYTFVMQKWQDVIIMERAVNGLVELVVGKDWR